MTETSREIIDGIIDNKFFYVSQEAIRKQND